VLFVLQVTLLDISTTREEKFAAVNRDIIKFIRDENRESGTRFFGL
jgi:hypothetical protein